MDIGSNFPTGLTPLYARFGSYSSPVVGVLLLSLGRHLITPSSFTNPTCLCAVCRQPIFRARSQSLSPAAPTPTLLFSERVSANSNTLTTVRRSESRPHRFRMLLTYGTQVLSFASGVVSEGRKCIGYPLEGSEEAQFADQWETAPAWRRGS